MGCIRLNNMKEISLNQIFKSTNDLKENDELFVDKTSNKKYTNLRYITSLDSEIGTALNISRPMFWWKNINNYTPALFFHSNPLQSKESVNPWRDVMLQEQGLVFYNGDNKQPGNPPGITPKGNPETGNHKVESLINLYSSKEKNDREAAPPIFIFESVKVGQHTKGFRKFIGVGIITDWKIRQQYNENNEVFSNYLFEITLISLEDGKLNWNWIDDRRNQALKISEINRHAPKMWKLWINKGNSSINKIRQKILKSSVSKPQKQIDELNKEHSKTLSTIVKHYESKQSKKDKFEALAALAVNEYFGKRYTMGWITQSSSDMGVDFVGRYDFVHETIVSPPGNILGKSSILVIGQAKCRSAFNNPQKGELTIDIARVASRLTRGTIGVFVTTGTYKESTQKEVALDELPIVLINGRQLADLIHSYLSRTGKKINNLLNEMDDWYDNHQSSIPPHNILHKDLD